MKCLHCNSDLLKDAYRCSSCGKWQFQDSENLIEKNELGDTILLSDVGNADYDRLSTGPWDYAWGGTDKDGWGPVKTGVTLLGGAPGSGKSTLLLQIADKCRGEPPLYVAAEEAVEEIRERADRCKVRLKSGEKNIRMVPALNGANIGAALTKFRPPLVIIDSLQGLVGNDAGAQEEICKAAKIHAVRLHCPIVIISHVTKDEVLAGKMTLQHLVDTTMVFFVDDEERVLLVIKNRRGPANVECAFTMTERGLKFVEFRDATGNVKKRS